jgi:hypothetical protein
VNSFEQIIENEKNTRYAMDDKSNFANLTLARMLAQKPSVLETYFKFALLYLLLAVALISAMPYFNNQLAHLETMLLLIPQFSPQSLFYVMITVLLLNSCLGGFMLKHKILST